MEQELLVQPVKQQATQGQESHFSGLLVWHASEVVKWNCLQENNNQTYIHKVLWASKLAVREVLHGELNLNSSQQVWYVGIQCELILD